MASSSSTSAGLNNGTASIITALGSAFKSQTGEPLSGDKIAQLLLQNMPQLGELAKQGKLNQQQIMQVHYRRVSSEHMHADLIHVWP
jgi:transcription initiation factor TFIID subunit 12